MIHAFRPWQLLSVIVAGYLSREQNEVIAYLKEENAVLREKLGVRRVRLNDDQRRRLAAKGKALGRRLLGEVCTIVTPDTILRWHRNLIARKYDGSHKRRRGRPGVMATIRRLVVLMAAQNPTWGTKRMVGALRNLNHTVSRSTVRRILIENGLDPDTRRDEPMPWATFLKAHWQGLAACDFFTVEVWTKMGLTRFLVFFIIDLPTRRVEIAGISRAPHGRWMENIARGLIDDFDGFLRGKRFLIHDRDTLLTKEFRAILKGAGVTSVRLPPKSPDLNAYAERFVRSIKSECLDRMIFFGEKHLTHAISEYIEHYHLERNHQGLGNQLINGEPSAGDDGPVVCHERLGGMLKYYERQAA